MNARNVGTQGHGLLRKGSEDVIESEQMSSTARGGQVNAKQTVTATSWIHGRQKKTWDGKEGGCYRVLYLTGGRVGGYTSPNSRRGKAVNSLDIKQK